MNVISHYQELISDYFSEFHLTKEPKNLYQPIEYILSLGGKRMRPILTLMATAPTGEANKANSIASQRGGSNNVRCNRDGKKILRKKNQLFLSEI